MFWFISPWEAARPFLEAQRQLMAVPWLFMASGRRYQGLADREQAPSEAPPMPARSMATAGPAAVPALRAMETIKEAPPMPARSMATTGPAAVPARRAVETIKGSVGALGKGKRPKRKSKNRKK
jgi:hypothetical protein